jgi:hypothetical protein
MRDRPGREDAGGHLIQQWLKEVMICAVHDSGICLGLRKGADYVQPTEPTADDDHLVTCTAASR